MLTDHERWCLFGHPRFTDREDCVYDPWSRCSRPVITGSRADLYSDISVLWRLEKTRFLPRDAIYASAVYAFVACPSVRLSITSRYFIETTGRIELGFLQGGFLSPVPHWVVRKYGHLSRTPGFQNFATVSRSRCQQHSSSSSSTVELVDDTYTTIDESWLFTTKRSTVTPLLRFVVDLLYNLFLQLTRF